MFKKILSSAPFLAAAAVIFLAVPVAQAAGPYFYAADYDLTLSGPGVTVTVMAGSEQEGLLSTSTNFTVTVGDGEVFVVRTAGPYPATLDNDALLSVCNVLPSKANQLLIRGPRTVTVTPGFLHCSTASVDTNTTPSMTFVQPAGGESWKSGSSQQLFWQTNGRGADAFRLRLSTDGGRTFPLVVADGLMNGGFYQWTVPEVVSTVGARLLIDGLNGTGDILAVAVSPVFSIEGTAPAPAAQPPATPAASYDYDPAAATAAAATIDVDKNFQRPVGASEPTCAAGLRIKAQNNAAVYFCGADGKRHAFPNQRIHDSWYAGNFAGVVTVSDAVLASIPLGPNATYRPGVRLVKIQTDPKVYAVAADGVLRWVPTEAAAQTLYGAAWSSKVDDVPDSFFADYTIGEPIKLN